MTDTLSQAVALRVIQSLKQGSNLLDGAGLISAGREPVIRGAEELLDELRISGGSAVRWLKGNYGSGKTHTFARIRESAHQRGWITSYVEVSRKGEGCELHRFEEIYAAIVKNSTAPGHAARVGGFRNGWQTLLDDWVGVLKRQAGARPGGDVPTLKVRDAVSETLMSLRKSYGISGSYAAALREYALASLDDDAERCERALDWFTGVDVFSRDHASKQALRAAGILEVVTRRNAKAMLRQMTSFLQYRGFSGVLVLFDEVENVLLLPPSNRRAAYTLVRELIDNVDATHGMTQTLLYLSGTPDLFDGTKGIAEYEALASRVMLSTTDPEPNPAGAVVDLEAFPIGRRDYEAMASRIMAVYQSAYPGRCPDTEATLRKALAPLDKNPNPTPRLWVRLVVEGIDRAAVQQ